MDTPMDTPTVGLQLYTVRAELARDAVDTLRQVAAMGYRCVESGGYGSLPVVALRRLRAETGLQVSATLTRLAALAGELARELDYSQAVGSPYLVLSWLAPEEREDVTGLARRLNEVGRRCRERGMAFAYHNHDFEFGRTDGASFLDRLLDATDPDVVALELDVYWAAYAGVDPVAYLRRYAGRVPLVHLKDMTADRDFADVGDGTLDIQAMCAAAVAGGARYVVVENDHPRPDGLTSARRSIENLRAMGLVTAPGAR